MTTTDSESLSILVGEGIRVDCPAHVRTADQADQVIRELQAAREKHFGRPPLTAAVIEVVEAGRATDDTLPGSLVVPTQLRINGHQVPTADGGVKIHEITLPGRDMAKITVTLPARRITVAAEGDLSP